MATLKLFGIVLGVMSIIYFNISLRILITSSVTLIILIGSIGTTSKQHNIVLCLINIQF